MSWMHEWQHGVFIVKWRRNMLRMQGMMLAFGNYEF